MCPWLRPRCCHFKAGSISTSSLPYLNISHLLAQSIHSIVKVKSHTKHQQKNLTACVSSSVKTITLHRKSICKKSSHGF